MYCFKRMARVPGVQSFGGTCGECPVFWGNGVSPPKKQNKHKKGPHTTVMLAALPIALDASSDLAGTKGTSLKCLLIPFSVSRHKQKHLEPYLVVVSTFRGEANKKDLKRTIEELDPWRKLGKQLGKVKA